MNPGAVIDTAPATPVARAAAVALAAGPQEAPGCILDTNVVLDWLVFADPHGLAIGEAVTRGRLQWLSTPAMQAELVEVLARLRREPALQRWQHREARALEMAAAWATPTEAPAPLPPHRQARCSDPDDQIFIDLASARCVPWLFSRDRAVLKLARRMRPWGVTVLTPRHWCETERSRA